MSYYISFTIYNSKKLGYGPQNARPKYININILNDKYDDTCIYIIIGI